jgi:hypothetical protein
MLEELAIGDILVPALYGHLIATAFGDVTVHEIFSGIELMRKENWGI